jgi:hydrogenase expression/formation protein HypE
MENTPLIYFDGASCPIPLPHNKTIVMGHGSGGKMTEDLIKQIFQKHFSNPFLNAGNDFALLPMKGNDFHLSVSTDAHIIFPLTFPGGDIGRLAICGTVNDMSMSGATPLYITASFILEEGLEISLLEQIVISMKEAALEAGVTIVAGDTKVVEKGKGDGIFISTTGIARLSRQIQINGSNAQPGDVVIISGTIGDHGIAVLDARGDLGIKTEIESDVAPLNHLIAEVLEVAPETHVLRDPTRGGLATTLNEIAKQSKVGIIIHEEKIPVLQAVKTACELLGFDPLYIANEGKLIIIAPENKSNAIISKMQDSKYGKNAKVIGEIIEKNPGRVILRTEIGTSRIVDVMAGEMLPRIC